MIKITFEEIANTLLDDFSKASSPAQRAAVARAMVDFTQDTGRPILEEANVEEQLTADFRNAKLSRTQRAETSKSLAKVLVEVNKSNPLPTPSVS